MTQTEFFWEVGSLDIAFCQQLKELSCRKLRFITCHLHKCGLSGLKKFRGDEIQKPKKIARSTIMANWLHFKKRTFWEDNIIRPPPIQRRPSETSCQQMAVTAGGSMMAHYGLWGNRTREDRHSYRASRAQWILQLRPCCLISLETADWEQLNSLLVPWQGHVLCGVVSVCTPGVLLQFFTAEVGYKTCV